MSGRVNVHFLFHLQPYVTTAFGRNALSASQDLDRIQDRADKTSSELRRTEAELRVTRVSEFHVQYFSTKSDVDVELFSLFNVSWLSIGWKQFLFLFFFSCLRNGFEKKKANKDHIFAKNTNRSFCFVSLVV